MNVSVWSVRVHSCAVGSSDEEEDEIGFSDYRGSDSDSGEGGEVYREAGRPHKHKRKGAKVREHT